MGSYKLLEKALRNSLLETVDAAVADYGEEGRTPSALWSLTRANLSRYPLGKAWEKLAHIASFFSADGFHKHILRHLWDALIAPGIAWEADNGQAFDQALDVLKRHGLLSNSNLELRMHRLTAEALHRSALEDDSTLEEKIGKFFAETLDAEDWFELLGKHPQFAEYCPGAMLEYSPSNWSVKVYWPMLLEKQPQLAKLCLEHNPNAMGWALVLGYLPEITDDCPWEKFGGRDWARLLARQPQFKDRCKWEKLDGHDWCILLGKQPQFADTSLGVPWEELDGFDWAQLLMSQPQLACHCLWWGKLDDSDWDNLLLAQPQFATYRDSRT